MPSTSETCRGRRIPSSSQPCVRTNGAQRAPSPRTRRWIRQQGCARAFHLSTATLTDTPGRRCSRRPWSGVCHRVGCRSSRRWCRSCRRSSRRSVRRCCRCSLRGCRRAERNANRSRAREARQSIHGRVSAFRRLIRRISRWTDYNARRGACPEDFAVRTERVGRASHLASEDSGTGRTGGRAARGCSSQPPAESRPVSLYSRTGSMSRCP